MKKNDPMPLAGGYRKVIPGVCCVRGCGNIATVDSDSGMYCQRCFEEITALRGMMQAKSSPDSANLARRPSDWLVEFLAAIACMLLLSVFLILTAPFWSELAQMWGIIK